jgi:hypothetical protein
VLAASRRLLLIALTALLLCAASAQSHPGAAFGVRESPPEPAACTPNPLSPTTVPASMWDGDSLCGGRGNDKIYSKKVNPIWGYQGDDTIYAAQNPPRANDINGGPGADRAYVDSQDLANLTGVEQCKLNGRGSWRSCRYFIKAFHVHVNAARRAFTYPRWQNYLQCRIYGSPAQREILFFLEPLVRAVDATAEPDWQTVAYKASLYKWTGTGPATAAGPGWTWVADKPWLWDRTSDEKAQPPAFGGFFGNYWRSFTSRQREITWFVVPDPGQFRVAVTIHWYATPTVPANETFEWAGPHYADDAYRVPGQQWCNFPT